MPDITTATFSSRSSSQRHKTFFVEGISHASIVTINASQSWLLLLWSCCFCHYALLEWKKMTRRDLTIRFSPHAPIVGAVSTKLQNYATSNESAIC